MQVEENLVEQAGKIKQPSLKVTREDVRAMIENALGQGGDFLSDGSSVELVGETKYPFIRAFIGDDYIIDVPIVWDFSIYRSLINVPAGITIKTQEYFKEGKKVREALPVTIVED